jgi:sugar lactone lactonase YvrE
MKRSFGWLAALVLCSACSGSGGTDETESHCDPERAGSICTIAGNGDNGYDGDEPIRALDAKLSLPQDLLKASDGTLYILDWNNHRVRMLAPDGMLKHLVGRGELGGTLDDPANSDLNHPTGLLLTPDESTLLVAAWHNSKIRAVDLASGEIVDECGDGRRGYFGDEAAAAMATLDLPSSIAFDPQGNLVILDQANQVIRNIDAEGVIHRLVGMCVTDQDVACEGAPVQCPNGSGKFTCGDPATECAKPCNPAYQSGDDALSLRMAQPFGQSADPGGRLVYDSEGALYFADTANHLIRRVTAEGEIEVVAGVEPEEGKPRGGTSPDGTPATETLLNRPTDLALAADGTLYFSDVYNHCVRKVAPDGNVYTVAGRCGQKGFEGDGGAATDARLKLPYGIELADGVLYVADTGNNRIRRVNLE